METREEECCRGSLLNYLSEMKEDSGEEVASLSVRTSGMNLKIRFRAEMLVVFVP